MTDNSDLVLRGKLISGITPLAPVKLHSLQGCIEILAFIEGLRAKWHWVGRQAVD